MTVLLNGNAHQLKYTFSFYMLYCLEMILQLHKLNMFLSQPLHYKLVATNIYFKLSSPLKGDSQ